jgi:hypothetical protein
VQNPEVALQILPELAHITLSTPGTAFGLIAQ